MLNVVACLQVKVVLEAACSSLPEAEKEALLTNPAHKAAQLLQALLEGECAEAPLKVCFICS